MTRRRATVYMTNAEAAILAAAVHGHQRTAEGFACNLSSYLLDAGLAVASLDLARSYWRERLLRALAARQ
jgi:hypothetical protein